MKPTTYLPIILAIIPSMVASPVPSDGVPSILPRDDEESFEGVRLAYSTGNKFTNTIADMLQRLLHLHGVL